MHLDRNWHFALNKEYKSGKERPVELPYFIVFGQTIGQLEKGDREQLSILWEVKWAQSCLSSDSTSIAAPAMCLCVTLQNLTIMFSFIPGTLLLPGSLYVPLSPVLIPSLMWCLCLSTKPPLLQFLKLKVSHSFPWWLLSDVGVLKCSKRNNLDVMTSVTFQIIICRIP